MIKMRKKEIKEKEILPKSPKWLLQVPFFAERYCQVFSGAFLKRIPAFEFEFFFPRATYRSHGYRELG